MEKVSGSCCLLTQGCSQLLADVYGTQLGGLICRGYMLFTGLFTTGKKCSEEVMGYEVYTSALADVLCEPSLTMPLTVGMYARWGSGKSFVLRRLQGMNSTSVHNSLLLSVLGHFVSYYLRPNIVVTCQVIVNRGDWL